MKEITIEPQIWKHSLIVAVHLSAPGFSKGFNCPAWRETYHDKVDGESHLGLITWGLIYIVYSSEIINCFPIKRHLRRIIPKTDRKRFQELYFVNENYDIFSKEVSAGEKQGQNSGGPNQGVIRSLGMSSVSQHFEFVFRLGSSWAAMFHVVALSLSSSYFIRPLVRCL